MNNLFMFPMNYYFIINFNMYNNFNHLSKFSNIIDNNMINELMNLMLIIWFKIKFMIPIMSNITQTNLINLNFSFIYLINSKINLSYLNMNMEILELWIILYLLFMINYNPNTFKMFLNLIIMSLLIGTMMSMLTNNFILFIMTFLTMIGGILILFLFFYDNELTFKDNKYLINMKMNYTSLNLNMMLMFISMIIYFSINFWLDSKYNIYLNNFNNSINMINLNNDQSINNLFSDNWLLFTLNLLMLFFILNILMKYTKMNFNNTLPMNLN